MGRQDFETETLIPIQRGGFFDDRVAHALRAEGFDASEDGTGRGTPLVAYQCQGTNVGEMGTLRKGNGNVTAGVPFITFDTTQITSKANRSQPKDGDPCHPLAAEGHVPAIAYAIQERAICENPDAGPDGAGFRDDGAAYTLEARTTPQAVAVALRGREDGATAELGDDKTFALRASSGGGDKPHVLAFSSKDHGADCQLELSPTLRSGNHDKSHANAGAPPATVQGGVRRLTPRECERLQEFPDDFTLIEYRGKPAADGPRYKALGNSMAVPVIRWILNRIEIYETQVRPKIGNAA